MAPDDSWGGSNFLGFSFVVLLAILVWISAFGCAFCILALDVCRGVGVQAWSGLGWLGVVWGGLWWLGGRVGGWLGACYRSFRPKPDAFEHEAVVVLC